MIINHWTSLFLFFQETVPLDSEYTYCICDYKNESQGFSLTLSLNTKTKTEAQTWFKKYTEKSLTTMRVNRTFPGTGPTNLFKVRICNFVLIKFYFILLYLLLASLLLQRWCNIFNHVYLSIQIRYRCQHNTRAQATASDKHSCKNTNCPAFVVLTVKNTKGRVRR